MSSYNPQIPIKELTPSTPEAVLKQVEESEISVLHTHQLNKWLKGIERCLDEICRIANEGKLNKEQAIRINSICRNVDNSTTELAVEYQSLKEKTRLNHAALNFVREKLDLHQQIQDLKQSINESCKPVAGPVSFSDMVKKGTNEYIQPSSEKLVAIYPPDKSTSSEETRTLVQQIIRPAEMNLHVRGLRKTKNGGVIISTNSKEDIEKLKQSPQLTSSGLTVDEPNKRNPRIVVIGVPTSMQETDVFQYIYQQNLADQHQGDLTLDSFMASIKLSHKSGRKDAESCNYIIEVPARIRKALISKDRLFINWSSCPVRDFTIVTRCFKCQQYGHAAKTCRAEACTCGHCGEIGHTMKDCLKRADTPKCATCLFFKKPSNHRTGDSDCPGRKMAEKKYINSIDYGSTN